MARMSLLLRAISFALVVLCLGGRTAHGQAAPVPYWSPGWPIGFGGNLTVDTNTAGFSGLDGSDVSGANYGLPNGWFVGGTRSGAVLNMNGINRGTAFGNDGSLYYEGAQFGYKFKNAPLSVYAGFDTLKYNTGIGGPFAPFDNVSGTLPGYSVNAGVEFRPTSNLSLSLGVGFTQQSGRVDSDINSPLLSGASAFPFGGRR